MFLKNPFAVDSSWQSENNDRAFSASIAFIDHIDSSKDDDDSLCKSSVLR